jgi:hypothetical protein
MLASVGALTENLFDYAGIYPPAQLPLNEALENYLKYLAGQEANLVAKFVCGVSKLPELRTLLEQRGLTPAFELTVVAAPPADVAEWESTLESAARTMTDFQNSIGGVASIEAFEIRVPSAKDIDRRLRDLRGFTDVDVFVETPWTDEVNDILCALSESETYYAKARLGGATAAAHPESAPVAKFIVECTGLDLPFKLTAGLHHPYPVTDSVTGGRMHGFVNVGVATGLALVEDLTSAEIENILNSNVEQWTAKGDDLKVGDHTFDHDTAVEARELLLGIGSCSIVEPFSDLIALGYLNY